MKYALLFCSIFVLLPAASLTAAAQQATPRIQVDVNLVTLNVAVTDRKGDYVTGLTPANFAIYEDKIPENIATFQEGSGPTQNLFVPGPNPALQPPLSVAGLHPTKFTAPVAPEGDPTQNSLASNVAGASVFILFDTSNYMYRGFVYAQDAIANFVRSLKSANKIAFYSYSRDLSRATPLTTDRMQILRGVRDTVAGDDAALYNALLLTVRDAARVSGRKVIVVFSNGPDNASEVPPEDVAELAQSTGTIIYMISTHSAELEPISTVVFRRMSKATGGKAYFARNWQDETKAFASIRNDLAHLYSISYYPKPNPNRGWRQITVKLVGKQIRHDRVRTRAGYRLQEVHLSREQAWTPPPAAKK